MSHDDKPLPELDSTAFSAADDRFEDILDKIVTARGKITKDETTPLFTEVNNSAVEIGEMRVVEINVKGVDFQITRNVKRFRSVGHGHHRSLEEVARPMVENKLKRKAE